MADDPRVRIPRSPLRVALLTFGAVVLIGMLITVAIVGFNDTLGDEPFARGEQAGRGVGILAAICATVAYFQQKRRLARK